ncbi:GAF domain-containing protein [candidate division KSB1 bacterium]|nr:GAF domain-containing protein [candidate division KSB1 bacterium]
MSMVNTLQTIPLLQSSFSLTEPSSSVEYKKNCENPFQKILYHLRVSVDYEWATLYSINQKTGKLNMLARAGEGIDFIEIVQFPMGSGLSAWVAQKKKMVHLPDIHRSSRHGHHPIRSFISMPLVIREKGIVVLNMAHIYPNAFSEKEINMLQVLTRDIAMELRSKLVYSCTTTAD